MTQSGDGNSRRWTVIPAARYTLARRMECPGNGLAMYGLDAASAQAHLERHGIRPTRQRLALMELLFAEPRHISAEGLLTLARRRGIAVSKATVYNTLNLLRRKGLLREVPVDGGRTFYDTNLSHHHHIYNVDTGELRDVPADTVSLARLPELPRGTEPDGVDVIIRVRSRTRA